MPIVVLILAALLAAGCGADDRPSLEDAAANSAEQSMRMEMTMKASSPQETFSLTGTATFDARGTRGTIEGDMVADGETFTGVRMLMDGGEAWMTAKEMREAFPRGKRWIHFRDPELASQTVTPAQFVAFLRSADGVEEVGSERVRDWDTTHYSGDVNVKDLVEESGGAPARQYEQLIGSQEVVLPMDVWIDEEGLIRRMTVDFDHPSGSVELDATVLQYGIPVDVSPPPERAVIEG